MVAASSQALTNPTVRLRELAASDRAEPRTRAVAYRRRRAKLLGHTDPKLTIEHYIRRNEQVNPLTAELPDRRSPAKTKA